MSPALLPSLCLLLTLSLFSISAPAEDGKPELPEFSPFDFRLGAVATYSQAGLQSSYSPSIDWNPEWNFATNWNLGLNIGILPMSQLSNKPLAFEYQLTLGRMLFSDIWLELGAGAQSWTTTLSTAPLVAAMFYFRFPDVILGILDRAYVGYSSCFIPKLYLNELRLGFGVEF